MPISCYRVPSDEYDYGHELVFDDRTISQMIDEYGDCVVHLAEWDQYAGKGVPAQVMLNAGWTIPCSYCECMCSSDGSDNEDGSNGPMVVTDRKVYCSQKCLDDQLEEMQRFKDLRFQGGLALILLAPWVGVKKWYTGCPGGCRCFGNNRENQYAEITFDGAKVNNNHYCFGCGKIWICAGDLSAWELAKSSYLPKEKCEKLS